MWVAMNEADSMERLSIFTSLSPDVTDLQFHPHVNMKQLRLNPGIHRSRQKRWKKRQHINLARQ